MEFGNRGQETFHIGYNVLSELCVFSACPDSVGGVA